MDGAREDPWAGGIRDLMEELESIQARHASFTAAARRLLARVSAGPPPAPRPAPGLDMAALMAAYERSLVLWALARTDGRQLDAARMLGVQPSTLNEKMKRLGVVRPHESPGLDARSPELIAVPRRGPSPSTRRTSSGR